MGKNPKSAVWQQDCITAMSLPRVVTPAKANCYSKLSENLYSHSYNIHIYIYIHAFVKRNELSRGYTLARHRLGCIVKRAAKRINHRSTATAVNKVQGGCIVRVSVCARRREIVSCTRIKYIRGKGDVRWRCRDLVGRGVGGAVGAGFGDVAAGYCQRFAFFGQTKT